MIRLTENKLWVYFWWWSKDNIC